MSKILFLVICITAFLSGCASSIKAFKDRSVIEDDLDGSVGTLAVTASRRMALVILEEGPNRGKFCAEPPPDVSENITTSLEAALKAKLANLPADIDASLKDSLKVEATVLAERTVILDVYRTGTYALCQYHLNGAVSDSELKDSFNSLTEQVIKSLSN